MPTGAHWQRAIEQSAQFNPQDNTIALDDGFTRACDGPSCPGNYYEATGAGNPPGLFMHAKDYYDYSVDVLAGSPVDAMLQGTVAAAACTASGYSSSCGVAGATVEAHLHGQPAGADDYEATTASDGSWYIADLPAGSYDVSVSEPPGAGLQGHSGQVSLSDGDDTEYDVALQPGATLQGTVSGGGQPLAGAVAQVCLASSTACKTVTADQSGHWSADGLAPGTYDVIVNPPAGAAFGVGRGSAPVPASGDVQLDLSLPVPQAPPAGTTISSSGSYLGAPQTGWAAPVTVSTQACADGAVSATASGYGASSGAFESPVDLPLALTEDPAGSGQYSGQWAGLYPLQGQATVSLSVTCPDASQDQSFSFDIFVQPQAHVVDQDGNAVEGATVTLLSADNPAGAFGSVPTGSALLSPDATANPQTTGPDGSFGWDAMAGYYEVQASAPGCVPAADTSQATATSPVFDGTLPLGLQLVLDCEPGAPTTLTYTGPTSADTGSVVELSAVLSSAVLAGAPALTSTATTLTSTGTTLTSTATTLTSTATTLTGTATTTSGLSTVTTSPSPGVNPTGAVAGEQVTLSYGSQSCAATTDSIGTATCSVFPQDAPGPATAGASFSGDAMFQASSTSTPASFAPDQPQIWFSPPGVASYGQATSFSGELVDEAGDPLVGQPVTFSTGTGAGAQSCSALSDATGWASCSLTIDQPAGIADDQASFAGNADAQAVVATGQTSVVGEGYWLVGADGTVYPEGGAPAYGSVSTSVSPGPGDAAGSTPAPSPAGAVVGIAPTPDGGGYWVVTANGDVYSFGDASQFCAGQICPSLDSVPAAGAQVVAVAADPTGYGYWLVGADGTVYPEGGAPDNGSLTSPTSSAPVVSMAATADGAGYWLATADGTVYSLGDASGYCPDQSCASLAAGQGTQVVSIIANPTGPGYWLLVADGSVHALSGADAYGSLAPGAGAAVGMSPSPDGAGYLLATSAGSVSSYGDANNFCAASACSPTDVAADIVGAAPEGIPTDYLPGTPVLGEDLSGIYTNTPTVTWAPPADITYGTALGAAQLDATAPVPGTFTYSPAAGAVLGAGDQTIWATFTPDDTADYSAVTTSVTLTVDQATPAVTWPAPGDITYGTALGATQLDATSAVPGTFTYSPPAGTVLGAGTQTLSATFTPTDSADYTSVSATTTLIVDKATPTLNWPAAAGITYGTALGAAQLDATASVPGTFSYSPSAGTVLGAGPQTLTVTFIPTDSADYNSTSATTALTVGFTQPCITTTVHGSLDIGAGQALCIGPGGRVTGSVRLGSGGALWVSGGSISGSLSSSGAAAIELTDATLNGSMSVNGCAGPVVVTGQSSIHGSVSFSSDKGGVTFEATKLTGSLDISSNGGGVGVTGATVHGSVSVMANTDGVSFTGNTVSGSVAITANSGGFTYVGNTVGGSVYTNGNS
ncbi:MAG TPA: hypothetical protein VFN61_00745 [Acidimicrobiales bacterium]|nr:hypothetical protein [Acidimicrobiales bacterium]